MEIDKVLTILERWMEGYALPAVSQESKRREPFRTLLSCMLSLRTKDEVTSEASKRLFALASDPKSMGELSKGRIEKAIYPVGFYKTKAKNIRTACRKLVQEHASEVPGDMDSLLALPGVGRKTANLVLGESFQEPAICVDTHVHRICNRLGYVSTKTPVQTEFALREKLPRRHWISINRILVAFGQNICKPISPFCSICRVKRYCGQIGVNRNR